MERCLERCQGRSRFGEEDQDRAPRRRSAPEAECSRFPVSGDAVASASSSRPGGDDYRPSRNPLLVEMSGIPPHLKPWVVEAIRVLQARPLVFIRSPDFRPHAFPLQQVETSEAGRTPRSNAEPGQGAPSAGEAVEEGYFLAGWSERTSSRRTRTLLSMCIVQIGRDFFEYRTKDEAIAQAFRLLPARCISRISRAASARGTISDQNIGLLCSPGVGSLWLRGRFTDEGANALLPTLRGGNSTNGKHDSLGSIAELVDEFREDSEGGDDGVESAQAKRESACGVVEEIGEAESWETADDRMEACLQGGVSITSLDISSPLMTPGFIARLVLRMPTLRRLGLRGSLDVVGGPDALCDYVPRLTALRELDVSYCTWFCDLCLRRFAKAMYREFPASGLNEISDRGRDSHSRWMIAMAQEQEGAADWGAASAPAMRSGGYLPAHGQPEALVTAERLPGGVRTSGVGAWGGVGDATSAKKATRFRTFTLTCLRTAVTEKGARRAESLSPGLMVVLEDC